MATLELNLDDERLQALLQGDRGLAVLLEGILNQVLQAELTDHLGAAPANAPTSVAATLAAATGGS